MFVLQTTAIGGMESHCIDLAGEYVRRGITVLAVVPGAAAFDVLEDRFRAAGAAVHRMDTDARRGRRRQMQQLARFISRARSFHPDVVHVQTGGATGGTAVVAIARLIGAVAVITEHDVPDERPSWRARASRYALDRATHALIGVSRRNARLRSTRIKPVEKRFAVVLNGVPLPGVDEATRRENRVAVREQFGIDQRNVVLGSVVRLAEGKGLRDLLQAIAILCAQGAECELLLVGDGPLRPDLDALCATLGVAEHVHFAGNQRQPGRFVDAFDAFVLAVPAGSMSIALLEAMARGVAPVITFCGPEEAVCAGETGLCAPPEDPAGLAATLAPLVRDRDLRERLGKAAAAHVRDHYSVARVADDILDIYAGAQKGMLPLRLRADAPIDARPGDRGLSLKTAGAPNS
jgi:glycosyltransferase involved in cell wall biosynthesis